ncbi:(2Fe-2S)-binding protein [Actinomycetospora termitidis]|uniref:(2Fe-2S)-binding protein n=1 Tax=Actinomycetospora termitidis TaxID=3053470 RepID=A0ABT7MD68_9PSEU|nr:(2Fe-2S)-binding protein [Actinomycetospora sp. Odt1-22]MDL5158616.1 (2Fe-2S)-binding protein [Actinomycetospora sp. Odt1-22]
MAATTTAGAALADVDTLGGFFVLSTDPTEGADPSWRPLPEFTGDVLDARIDQIAGQLNASRRVAGSLLGLSVSARITGLVLGAAALHGLVPRLHDRVHWRPWSGGPAPLWLETPEAVDHDDLAATATAEIDRTLRPVLAAIRAQAAVSDQVLWGNVASSVGGALRMILTDRPREATRATATARAVVANPPLLGLGEFRAEPAHPTGIGFGRRTCCLFYQVPGGGTCGDCVLASG